jgi:hypothetical protein
MMCKHSVKKRNIENLLITCFNRFYSKFANTGNKTFPMYIFYTDHKQFQHRPIQHEKVWRSFYARHWRYSEVKI